MRDLVAARMPEHLDRCIQLVGEDPFPPPAERGRRPLPVDVAGAFHSPSMEPAVQPFRATLDGVEVGELAFPVFSCASAEPFGDVRAELAAALTRPVRWRETMLALHAAGA